MQIKFLLLVPVVLLSVIFYYDSKPARQWVIDKNCSLKVSGRTNINTFECVITNYAGSDTLHYRFNDRDAVTLTGSLNLYVEDFDCRDRMMTRDLRKSLRHQKFPKLIIRFLSLNKYPGFRGKSENLSGFVTIELAGVVKRIEVKYIFTQNGTSTATLVGKQKVNFSDFNIDPPQKLNGLIKAKNELDVEFNLAVRIL